MGTALARTALTSPENLTSRQKVAIVCMALGSDAAAKLTQKMSPEDVDAMLGAVRDIPYVLFVTVRVDKGWQDQVNETLRDAASRHPSQVKIVDWYGASNGHHDWFYSDGTHVNPTGAQAYANLLGSAVPPPPTPTPRTSPPPTSRSPTGGATSSSTPSPSSRPAARARSCPATASCSTTS